MRWMAVLLTTVLAVTTSACMMDGVGPRTGTGDGQLLILNALGEEDKVTLFVDGVPALLPAVGRASAQALIPGTHTLEVRSQAGALLGTKQFVVSPGSRRTALVAGSLAAGGAFSFQLAVDTASLPGSHRAKIRFIQAAPGAPPLRLFFYEDLVPPTSQDPPLVALFSFGSGSATYFPEYYDRPAGFYVLKAYDLDGTLVDELTMTLGKSFMWSVVLVRNAAGEVEFRRVREGTIVLEPESD